MTGEPVAEPTPPWPTEAYAALVEACRAPAFRAIVEAALAEATRLGPVVS